VKAPPADGLGIYGSGLFIVNPPYTLPALLKRGMPYLVEALGQDAGGRFGLKATLE
jgi:23S rRNA (adenine2030-N6)-methyltransferase